MVGRRGRTRDESLMQEVGITSREIGERKQFLQFGEEDVQRLASINELANRYASEIIEAFYRHLLSFEEARPFFHDDQKLIEYVKQQQKEYFVRLTEGDYGDRYVEDRLHVGAVHERIDLPIKLYLGMYSFYLSAVAEKLDTEFASDPVAAARIYRSLLKLVFLDIGLAIDTYVSRRERTIREQQEAIAELSTPVLQLRPGLLILPIVGVVDSMRARMLTEQLLRTIRSNRARVVVMDVTGVPLVDSAVANHLVQTVEAARLMGTTVIVTGLSPEIAQTLATLGLDLSMLNTLGDLQSGIEQADRVLGYRTVKVDAWDKPTGTARPE